MKSFNCLECQESFDSQRSLHAHIKKHEMFVGDYYVKHYARRNKLTGELLPYKNHKSYFENDFSTPNQIFKWIEKSSDEEVKSYLLELLQKRINDKNLDYGPSDVEFKSARMPAIDFYKKYFGSYTEACKFCGVTPKLNTKMPEEFWNDFSETKILVDTREKTPLEFNNQEIRKIDVGDYSVESNLFNYTFVDRKSIGDFCGTVTTSYNRFAKELDRCREMGCFVFVVVESTIDKIIKNNVFSGKRYNLDYVYHNMRELQHNYRDCCQFVFSGSRYNSAELIPKLLVLGKSLWKVDVHYYWDKYQNQE